MACSQAAQKGRGKTGELTAGGQPGQPVPAPTVSPFWGRAAALGAHGVPGGRRQTKRRWPPAQKRKPQGESALERSGLGFIRGPVSCGLSRGFARQPDPARDGLPASGGRPASLPCAAGLEALRSRGARLHGRVPEGGAKGNAGSTGCCAGHTRMWGLRASGAWGQASTASTSCSAGAASAGMRLPSTGFPSTVRVRRPFSSPARLRMWMR